jgi:hypothetical protein
VSFSKLNGRSRSPEAAVGGRVHAALSVLDEVVGARQAAGEAELVRLGGHLGGDARRDAADVGERREDETPAEVLLRDLLRQRLRRRQQHVVVDADGAGDHHAEAEPWEDVGVVGLPGDVDLALVLHRVEGAAAGEHGAALGPGVGLLLLALRVRRRVRQREDDGFLRVIVRQSFFFLQCSSGFCTNEFFTHLVEGRHGLDDLLGEGAADAGGADEHRRLDGLRGLEQGLEGLVLVRPRLLEVLERLLPRLHDQTLQNGA